MKKRILFISILVLVALPKAQLQAKDLMARMTVQNSMLVCKDYDLTAIIIVDLPPKKNDSKAQDKGDDKTSKSNASNATKNPNNSDDSTGSRPRDDEASHTTQTQRQTEAEKSNEPAVQYPLSILNDGTVFWVVAGVIALALILHFAHLIAGIGTRRQLDELKGNVKRLALSPGPNGGTGSSERPHQYEQKLKELSTQIQQLDQRLHFSEQDNQDLANSIIGVTRWLGDTELQRELNSNGSQVDEYTRQSILQVIDRNQEPINVNAARVEPLRQVFSNFIVRLNSRSSLPPDLIARAERLRSDIELFNNWQRDVESEYSALKLGSPRERQSKLHTEHNKLIEQLEKRELSMADHIEHYHDALDHYLTTGSSNGPFVAPTEYEAELKRRVSGAADMLMDWFDNFFQLQLQSNLMARGTAPTVGSETLNELLQVQKVAREVLSKFDVQPEEIQVGRTSYDRRLHEAALIRQSLQVPANTIIGVQRCGFRRVSTGEVLRRPQVVVAGASAG